MQTNGRPSVLVLSKYSKNKGLQTQEVPYNTLLLKPSHEVQENGEGSQELQYNRVQL